MKRAVYVSAKSFFSNGEKAVTFKKILDEGKIFESEQKANPIIYTLLCAVLLLIPWFLIIGILAVLGFGFSWKLGLALYGVLALLGFLFLRIDGSDQKSKRTIYNEMLKDVSDEKTQTELFLTTTGVEIGEDIFTWDKIDGVMEFEDWLVFYTIDNRIGMFRLKGVNERKLNRIFTILENKELLYQILKLNQ